MDSRHFGLLAAAFVFVLVPLSPGGDAIAERPLAPRSAPRGATMFAALLPQQTGVVTENRYADPKMWWERYQEFTIGAIGTGLANADYDHDGRPDLFVVSKSEGNRLFRNLGGWRFEDVTEKAGVGGTDRRGSRARRLPTSTTMAGRIFS